MLVKEATVGEYACHHVIDRGHPWQAMVCLIFVTMHNECRLYMFVYLDRNIWEERFMEFEAGWKMFSSVKNIVCNTSIQVWIYWPMGMDKVAGQMNNKTRLVRTWPIKRGVGIINLTPWLL